MLWLLLLVPLCWYGVFRYRRRHMYKLAAQIPSLPGIPMFGHALMMMGDTQCIMQALIDFSYHAINNCGITKAWLGHILYFIMVDPTDLEVVLKVCLEKDDLHRFVRNITGYGGIFAPVPIWRRRRKILVPAFSPRVLENFVQVFAEQATTLANRLAEKDGFGPFSAWPYVSTYTLDSVCETTMGVKIDAQKNPNIPFLKSMNILLRLVCERIFHLWLQPNSLFKISPQYSEHEKCIKIMHNFTDQVIRNKKLEIESQNNNQTEVDHDYDINMYGRKTFLDLLISLSGGEKGYTNVELREEVLTLTVAGTDTSAVAIGFTLKLLAKYPNVQEKVYQELCDVFGNSNRSLVKEDLTKLVYLERVIKESLRLFPPVPFIIRKVLEDIKLPSGRVLPGGSGVAVSIWGIHRDPKYWGPEAEHFDPDRFSPERFNLQHACSFMPFSSGPRNCLGYQYALMSVKTALATVLRSSRVLGEPEPGPIPNIPVKIDIMMKAVDEYNISLVKREVNR